MTGLFRRLGALAMVLALSACEMSLPLAGTSRPEGPNPVTGGTIEVTPLGPAPTDPAPSDPASADPAGAPSAASGGKAPVTPPTDTAKEAAGGNPAARPAAEKAPEPTAPAPPPPAAQVPEATKSTAQLACEKRKGVWSRTGSGGHACVSYTKDSGKSCRRKADCESQCLARSGTCAPYAPLFGCNEILDDMGRRMTLCLD